MGTDEISRLNKIIEPLTSDPKKTTNPRKIGIQKDIVGAMGTKLNGITPAKPAKINARDTMMMPPGTIPLGIPVIIKTVSV